MAAVKARNEVEDDGSMAAGCRPLQDMCLAAVVSIGTRAVVAAASEPAVD